MLIHFLPLFFVHEYTHSLSVPTRIEYAIIEPPNNISNTEEEEDFVRPSKKQRIHNVAGVNSECHHTLEEVRHATLWIDSMLQ